MCLLGLSVRRSRSSHEFVEVQVPSVSQRETPLPVRSS